MQSYSDLPDEVIVNILSRLPAKTVGQCRCVSNPWRSLLSRPDFITTHLYRSRNLQAESLLLVSEARYHRSKQKKVRHPLYYASLSDAHHLFDEITISAKRLKFSSEHNFMTRVHGSCDGLLLVGNWDGEMFVLNPITNEIREVPKSPFGLNLEESGVLYGFGYDLVNGDYKIVTISYYCDEHEDVSDNTTEMFVNVYSLKTGTWKKCESSPYNHGVVEYTSGAFLDGCIHWLAFTIDCKPTIVAFDLAQEKFREVSPPSSIGLSMSLYHYGYAISFPSLVVLGGCLGTFSERENEVWVMKEYGVEESWAKFTIDDPDVVESRPLCMFGQEEMVLKDCERLVVYNLTEETMKDIVVDGVRRDLVDETSFVESLVSPHGSNETMRE